jgi:hypothetical protein
MEWDGPRIREAVEALARLLDVRFGSITLRISDARWVHYIAEVSGKPDELGGEARRAGRN